NGTDLADGVTTSFSIERPSEITDEDFAILIDNSIGIMEERLANYGLEKSQIVASSTNISLTLPVNSYDEDFYSAIYSNGLFEICTYDETTKAYTVITDSTHFTDVYVSYGTSTYYVVMVLDDEAKTALATLTETASETSVKIYFRVDGEDYTTSTLTEQFDSDTVNVSTTDATAAQFLYTILGSGNYGFTMTMNDIYVAEAISGETAINWANIGLAVIALAVAVAFIVNYGLSGLAASISLLITMIASLLTATFIYRSEISVGAFIGFYVGIAVFALFNTLILEKYRKSANTDVEPNIEKRLRASMTKSYATYTKPIVWISLMVLVASITIWAAAPNSFKTFGVLLTYFTVFGLFSTLYVTKLFANIFYTLSHSPMWHRVSKEVKAND
ncbi:MAG TPA: hypothetical protein PK675_04150, partial [Clostridia bacterium]|nr:hypothetical protein [Clostridia bacterium]